MFQYDGKPVKKWSVVDHFGVAAAEAVAARRSASPAAIGTASAAGTSPLFTTTSAGTKT